MPDFTPATWDAILPSVIPPEQKADMAEKISAQQNRGSQIAGELKARPAFTPGSWDDIFPGQKAKVDVAPVKTNPITDTVKELGRSIWEGVTVHTPAAISAAYQGADVSDEGLSGSLIAKSSELQKQRKAEAGGNLPSAIPGIKMQDIRDLGQNLGFSLTAMGAGLAAGIPASIVGSLGTPVAGTMAGYGAGMAAAGKVGYNMDVNQVTRQLKEAADEESQQKNGRPQTADEWKSKLSAMQGEIQKHGLYEAVPEALGSGAGFAILTTAAKVFGKGVIARFSSKLGALYGEEMLTETVTQIGQQGAETRMGLHPGEQERSFASPQDWIESAKEVAPQVFLLTTLTAGGVKAGQMAFDAAKPAPQQPALTGQPSPPADVAPPTASPEQPAGQMNAGPQSGTPVAESQAPGSSELAPGPGDTGVAPGQVSALPLSLIDQARADAQILKTGELIPDETRLKNATLLSVYGENAAVRHVIEQPERFAGIADAMILAAPTVERVRGAIAGKAEDMDITPDILGAIDELAQGVERGQTLAQAMAQSVAHDISYEGQQMMAFLDENSGNPKKIAQFLENYLHEVERLGGVQSQVRGRAFDIIQERNEAKLKEAEKLQAEDEARAARRKESEVGRMGKQAATEVKIKQVNESEKRILQGVETALAAAFKNAKPLRTKGKPNAKPSAEGGRAVPSGTPSPSKAGPGQAETTPRGSKGPVSEPDKAAGKVNAQLDDKEGDRGGAAEKPVNKGKQIAAEIKNVPVVPKQEEGFNSEAFDKRRADTIKASRESGAIHLDKVPAAVESMRGREIFYAHDTKVRGVIRTVDNRGNVYVNWADKYSAEKELASESVEDNKAWLKASKDFPYLRVVRDDKTYVMQTSLGPSDMKDYVFADSVKAAPVAPKTVNRGAAISAELKGDLEAYTHKQAKRLAKLGDVKQMVIRHPTKKGKFAIVEVPKRERTAKQKANDARLKARRNSVDASRDSLFAAIGKLGGLDRDAVKAEWGIDPKDSLQSGVIGKPVLRVRGGSSVDGMAESLGQYGYLPKDENGKIDLADFEELFGQELRGGKVYAAEGIEAQAERRRADQEADFLAAEAEAAGIDPNAENIANLDLSTLASELDPDGFERLTIQYEGRPDTEFWPAVQEFVDEHFRRNEANRGAGQEAGGAEPGTEQRKAAYNADQQGFDLAPAAPIAKKKQGPTPQVASPSMLKTFIGIAADSIEQLRKVDVDRVLTSNPKIYQLSIANHIRENRPDLADEVDAVLAEESPLELTGETNAEIAAAEKAAKDARAAADAANKAAEALEKAAKERAAIKEASAKAEFNLTSTEAVAPKDQKAIDAKAATDQLAGQDSLFQTGPKYDTPVSVDPDSLSREVLSRMDKTLKSMGYDSHGVDDVRAMLKTRIAPDGVISFPDWIAAYQKAIGSAASRIENKKRADLEKERAKNVDWERVRSLGATSNMREAGYITPSGSMIDLSGKREGGTPNERALDHREVGGSKGMQEFMALGNIRMDMNSGSMDIAREPTPEQYRKISEFVNAKYGEVTIDLEQGLGEERDSYYLKAGRAFSRDYAKGVKGQRVVADIQRFFAGQDPLPISPSLLRQPKQVYNPDQAELIYETQPLRTGTTPEQKKLGIIALQSLFGRKRVAGGQEANDAGGSEAPVSTLLGSALWRDFQEHAGSELIGKQAGSASELALAAQILRDPRFETLRIFFVKAGKIVGHTGWTSRLPGSVSFSIETTAASKQVNAGDTGVGYTLRKALLQNEMKNLGADGYYMLHNHPSGRALPSRADEELTIRLAKEMPGFLGHTVIDHNEYASISKHGSSSVSRLSPTPAATPEVAHDALGMHIEGPSGVVAVGKMLQIPKGYVTLIATNAVGNVQALAEVPEAMFLDSRDPMGRGRALVRIRKFMNGTGSAGGAFIVGENPSKFDWLIKRGDLTDAVGTDGKTRSQAGIVNPRYIANNNKRMVLAARQMAWHGSPHTFDEFKLQHIGSGEGAQAYGWGMYFAGAKEVAEYYRKTTSSGDYVSVNDRKIGLQNTDELSQEERSAALELLDAGGDFRKASKRVENAYYHPGRILLALQQLKEKGAKIEKGGKLYQVELAPKESDYLDWDKPLSEQSEKVKAALKDAYDDMVNRETDYHKASELSRKSGFPDSATGQQIYRDLGESLAKRVDEMADGPNPRGWNSVQNTINDRVSNEEAASRYLNSIGIPGIRYLDGSSRGKGDGNHNYVIFDDSHVSITGVEQPAPPYNVDGPETLRNGIQLASNVSSAVAAVFQSPSPLGTLNPFQTPYHKGEMLARKGIPGYKRVFQRLQHYLNDIAKFAVEAEQLMPQIMRELKGIAPKDFRQYFKGAASEADLRSIGPWLNHGTLYGGGNPLEGVVWTNDELRGKPSKSRPIPRGIQPLTEAQIPLYHQALAGLAKSIETSGKAVIYRHIAKYGITFDRDMSLATVATAVRQQIMEKIGAMQIKELDAKKKADQSFKHSELMAEAAKANRLDREMRVTSDNAKATYEKDQRALDNIRAELKTMEALRGDTAEEAARKAQMIPPEKPNPGTIMQIAEHAKRLIDHGYMPLKRFGNKTVTAYDKDGKTRFFGAYDGIPLVPGSANAELAAVAAEIKALHPEWTVKTGTRSEKAWQLYQGLSLDALENFLDFLDPETKASLERDKTIQEYLTNSVNNRSVLKEMIHRKGTPGFSTDVPRILASFITAHARNASGLYHLSEAKRLVNDIPQEYGTVRDEATDLIEYVEKPGEEAAKLRSFLFFNFLGGSIAAAAVNLTQTVVETLPFLSKYAGTGKTTAVLVRASKMAIGDPASMDGELGKDLQRAELDGVTAPQQIYHLAAMASNNPFSSDRRFRTAMAVWSGMFGAAEVFNRRVAFIAAHNIYESMDSAARNETGFNNAYDFAKDTVDQTQGIYNKGNRPNLGRGAIGATVMTFKQFSIMYLELLRRLPPKQQLMMLGILLLMAGAEGLPFAEDIEDLVNTLGQWLGFTTNTGKWAGKTVRDTLGKEFERPLLKGIGGMLPIDLHSRLGMQNLIPGTAFFAPSEIDKTRDVAEAFGPFGGLMKNMSDGLQLMARGKWDKAAVMAAPKAARDFYNGAHMAITGESIDTKGRPAMREVTPGEAFGKLIGFNPQRAAIEGEIKREAMVDKNLRTVRMDDMASDIADAMIDKDPARVKAAMDRLREWNTENPELRIGADQMARSIRARILANKMTSEQRFLKSVPKAMKPEVRESFRQ